MTEISFFGGIGEIGGNIILLETEESRILFDFGKNFKQESKFFSEFLNPRKSHGLEDFIELGLLPDLDGVYRRDYLKHIGREAEDEASVDAVFITHAHMDHVGYLHFLRGD
ncbi:MAG: MBL fold metallo-hydrolase, partial [Candidatus Nanohaloarchaea archaeon]